MWLITSFIAAIIATAAWVFASKKYHTLLGGGTIGLALEHVAHQEIVPYFPYLTAMKSVADTATMLNEIATIGMAMLLACIAVWATMVVIASAIQAPAKTVARRTA
ncbi:MAG: hypothetical protein NT067_02600 [Candidatus Diapherotrites archaeon]|nr:hypothetical protein [Candidatus Diapherotrites archaeon]